jgi:hypothetical protein
VRGLLPLGLALALGATGGLAWIVLTVRPQPPAEAPAPELPPAPPEVRPEGALRAYETVPTLVEDLRDALAGDPALVDAELWRVSRALASRARWTLVHGAPAESSPRVRALLVLAAGVHVADDPLVVGFLEDPDPRVRAAAALALGYRPEGPREGALLGVRVPLGRTVPADVAGRLAREDDEGARGAMEAALGVSPRR